MEYHKNRCGIILKEAKQYADTAKALDAVGVALRSRKQHPHIDSELVARFEVIETEINRTLKEGESTYRGLITADSLCEKITELFDEKVGLPMTEEMLGRIYREGATRYACKIPPGFSDVKKPEPDRYGDLVVWYQLIEHATTSKRPVVLVTDDLKEDWWAFAGDQRIGPRPELRHEFRSRVECDIYIYSCDAFIEIAKDRGKKLSVPAAEEVASASRERQHGAIETRRLRQLACDPLEHYRKQQEMLERLACEPLEYYRKQQEMLERLGRDPLEHYRKQQEMLERLACEPLEYYRKQQEMLERLGRDPLEHYRKQQEILERLTHDSPIQDHRLQGKEGGCVKDALDESQVEEEQREDDEGRSGAAS